MRIFLFLKLTRKIPTKLIAAIMLMLDTDVVKYSLYKKITV